MSTWYDEANKILRAANITHFKAEELITQDQIERGNSLPNLIMVNNIIPTLKILEEARESINEGKPIKINSGYRSRAYNAMPHVNGRPQSYHIKFMAVDVVPKGCTPKELAIWIDEKVGNKWGLEIHETFVHVDCRSPKFRKGF